MLRRWPRATFFGGVIALSLAAEINLTARGESISSADSGPSEWKVWRAKRLESVKGTNGWTTVVGLFWLDQGANTIGHSPTNRLVITSGNLPDTAGSFIRHGTLVHFSASPGVDATIVGKPIREADLISDLSTNVTRLEIGGVAFQIIDRNGRIGLRVKDPEAPARALFRGLRYFPYDPHWRITGHFAPAASPQKLRIPDVTGGIQKLLCPGAFVFAVDGVEYHLDLIEEENSDEYSIIFRDKTAGVSTYGAGRFVDIAKQDSDGRLILDFNFAYNPPCAFTSFATCPLPPSQNFLPIAIPAGELNSHTTD